jgi:hypothetical protein
MHPTMSKLFWYWAPRAVFGLALVTWLWAGQAIVNPAPHAPSVTAPGLPDVGRTPIP